MNTINFDTHSDVLERDFHILRLLAVLPAALLTTFALIWGMEWLIRSDPTLEMPVPPEYQVPNPILEIIEPTPLQIKKPEPPEQVEVVPQLPELALHIETESTGGFDVVPIQKIEASPQIGHFASNAPVATLMMQPNYPAVAVRRGYEGHVDVQFDVAATGATENVVAIAANPPKIFDRSAVQAVKRWKYSPVMIDGEAQRYEGMVQRIVFELEK